MQLPLYPPQHSASIARLGANVTPSAGQTGGSQPGTNNIATNSASHIQRIQLSAESQASFKDKVWPKIATHAFHLSLVVLGIAIAWVYGRLSQRQNNQNLMATLWRDCVDLSVYYKSFP